jgi:hypothetical protein
MKRILNPDNGAPISTQFVALGKEKRDEEGNITNAKNISIGVGQSFVATDEEFEFLMKTFGFLQNGGATEELPAEPVVVVKNELEEIKLDEEDKREVESPKTLTAEEEFEELKAIGYMNLKRDKSHLRKRYLELKELLKK